MSGFYNYDTRGASFADQIINLERMVKERDEEIKRQHNRAKRAEKERDDANTLSKERYYEIEKLRVELETTKYLVIQREIDVEGARREIERLQWTRDAVFADGFDAGGEAYTNEVAKLRDKVNELQRENEQLRKEVDKWKNDSWWLSC